MRNWWRLAMSVESRPITTSNYLTESVERHREMEASRLRDYLKAKESDANKPWNKPGWPGPKKSDDESLRELEHIKKSIETLQKVSVNCRLCDVVVVSACVWPCPSAFKCPPWCLVHVSHEFLTRGNSPVPSVNKKNDL
ncbi:hypothetical protein ANCCAN_19056 [Ancylostoma caninum]|uniref:Uncharacterized protein n=1 Tax=Ancylostoma caninum TaxID=29170 RepID=A0A368FS98_ANCCA|nr:hypothetical protein ANCCAN_19056 [Ancylostoma caninum]